MHRRKFGTAALGAVATVAFGSSKGSAGTREAGIVSRRSSYGLDETVNRLVRDIAAKKIRLFNVINQSDLAKEAGVDISPSTLIIFGNPPLGTQFLSANAQSGLDWPVRLLVYEDRKGQVWTAYSDFAWVARRYNIRNRPAQFKMASEVIASIVTSTIKTQ